MAIDRDDDINIQPAAKSRFSFRKLVTRWAGKILPDRGNSASNRAAGSNEPTSSNSVGMTAKSSSSRNFVLPEIDVDVSLSESMGLTGINKPLAEKPLPSLPRESRSPEERIKSAFDNIIDGQAEAMMHASAKLKLGKWALPPARRAADKLSPGAGDGSKLSPGATRHPLSAMKERPLGFQVKPSAFGPQQEAKTGVGISGARLVSTGEHENKSLQSETPHPAEFTPISRSSSVSSMSSVGSESSISSIMSDISASSSADTADKSMSTHYPVEPKHEHQPELGTETRTRPPREALYEPRSKGLIR